MADCNAQYIICEECCGSNCVSMSTSNPNPSVSQSPCKEKGCGGASNLADALNAIGRWGTALTGTIQGKPVSANASGVAVGAKGTTSLAGNRMSGNSMLLILVIVGVLIFMATRK